MTRFKQALVRRLPRSAVEILRLARHPSEVLRCLQFVGDPSLPLSSAERLADVRRFFVTTCNVESPHRQSEILAFARAILSLSPDQAGVVVEAGCFRGSSTAKFSIVAKQAGRELIVFDSFQGLPAHRERHESNIFGGPTSFTEGAYRASLEEVRRNVAAFGEVEVCRFIPGWFQDTLPSFRSPVAAAYLDVDLVQSTRTCVKYLYPLLVPGGALYSQDGHLPLVIDAFEDALFWETEVGFRKPEIHGLRTSKLIWMIKPLSEGA